MRLNVPPVSHATMVDYAGWTGPTSCFLFLDLPKAYMLFAQLVIRCVHGTVSWLAGQRGSLKRSHAKIAQSFLYWMPLNVFFLQGGQRQVVSGSVAALTEHAAQRIAGQVEVGSTPHLLKSLFMWFLYSRRAVPEFQKASLAAHCSVK